MVSTVASFESPTDMEGNNISQIAYFLKNHEEMEVVLPVLFGLYVTSQFQLRGASALFVNLAVATTFRQLFKQLKESPVMVVVNGPETQPTPPANVFGDGVEIVHSVPGRIRLRIEQLSKDPAFAKRLERLLNQEDCIISTRINRDAASIAINYVVGEWSDLDLGLKLMSILNQARSEDSVSEVTLIHS